MLKWNYQEEVYKDIIFTHAKDIGRLYCETALQYPKLYVEFWNGFFEAAMKQQEKK